MAALQISNHRFGFHSFIVIPVVFVWMAFGMPQFITAQTNASFIKGERPFIDLQTVPDSAFEQNRIEVKFLPRFDAQLNRILSTHTNVFTTFDIPILDSLNKEVGLDKADLLFFQALKNSDKPSLHQQYGFHRWCRLYFKTNQNIKVLIQKYFRLGIFEVVEPIYKKKLLVASPPFTPNDPQFADQWNYHNTGQGGFAQPGADIHLPQAWDLETGKPSVIVAVIDEAIKLDHPDLAQNIAVGKSFNFQVGNSALVPGNHGSHVAGTIAAVNNNGIGVSGIAGGDGSANSGVRLMSCQVFDPNGNGGDEIASAFVYAADQGAAICNNSWAYTNAEDVYEISVMDAIDYFINTGGGNAMQGGLVLFAAGNSNTSERYYPSAYDRVICVGATDNRDVKTFYSTYGSWVDISAPGGVSIPSSAGSILSTNAGTGYFYDNGTSMACPHVAGVAALVASTLLGNTSANEVRNIMLSTADNVDVNNPNFIGLMGTGRVNAYSAVLKAKNRLTANMLDPVSTFSGAIDCSDTIQLQWTKNVYNNDVLIAYSSNNTIPTLENGKAYNVGDTINGATKVIYKGNGQRFSMYLSNHGSNHFFKIWSLDAHNNYSYGKTFEPIDNEILSGGGMAAISQNFDPPLNTLKGWSVINPDSSLTWTQTCLVDTIGLGYNDNYSIAMYNYTYNPTLGAADILTTPKIKLFHPATLNIDFWYSYKYRHTNSPVADSLELVVSSDCGQTFQSVWKAGGRDLATISDSSDVEWKPFHASEWKHYSSDLNPFKNADNIIVGFRAVNGKGNNLFLDNISFAIQYPNDASIARINYPTSSVCSANFQPIISLHNKGVGSISSATIYYAVDNNPAQPFKWSGKLSNLDDSVAVQLPVVGLNNGVHTLTVFSSMPNNAVDNYTYNDTASIRFIVNQPTEATIQESFESATFPPPNWEIQQQPYDNLTWNQAKFAASKGSRCAFMENYMYGNPQRTDDLISPLVAVPEMDSAFLKFDWSYLTRLSPDYDLLTDTFEIDVSKDCGTTWTAITRKGGKELETIALNSPIQTEYFPANMLQWKSDSLSIGSFVSSNDNIRFRFRNITGFGNNLYLDNIHFYTKKLPKQLKQQGYVAFPNPFDKKITIQFLQPPTHLRAIQIHNLLGQKVVSLSTHDTTNKTFYQLPTENLSAGVYILSLVYTNKIVTQRIQKQLN